MSNYRKRKEMKRGLNGLSNVGMKIVPDLRVRRI
jgi:hypothetical protein